MRRKMWWPQRRNISTFCLVLVTFVLSIDFTAARDPDRRVANYDIRKTYGIIQNDKRIPYHKRIQGDRRNPAVRRMQDDRRISTIRSMQVERKISTIRRTQEKRSIPSIKRIQNDRKSATVKIMLNSQTFSTTRRFLNQKSVAMSRRTYDRSVPDARRILLNRRSMLARRIEYDRNVPTDKKIQETGIVQYGKKIQNDRVQTFNNKTLQKDKSIRNGRRVPIIRERVKTYDKVLPSYRRVPGISRLQYDKGIQTVINEQHETIQPDDMKINDQFIEPDRIIDTKKRLKISKLLEDDRMQQNILRRKIDSILRNDKLVQNVVGSPNDRYRQRIKDERRILQEKRMQNARRMQNVRKNENVRKVQDSKRIFDENNQKIANARRMRNDRRMWVATPAAAVFRQFIDNTTVPPNVPDQFNSSELGPGIQEPPADDTEKGIGWVGFWTSLMMIFRGLAALSPAGTDAQKVRACLHIATTYMSALKDLRKYFELRYFYENNLHYEVGYITNEIISKYQRMLEIYHIAQDRWFKNQNKEYASNIYMLYLYTNVLEMGTVIGHLCNMLNELEDKFHEVPKTGFVDYHLPQKPKFFVNGTDAFENSVGDYEKRLLAERKRRERERRKMRKKNLFAGYKPTTPDRRPRPSSWPLQYGWSIEYIW